MQWFRRAGTASPARPRLCHDAVVTAIWQGAEIAERLGPAAAVRWIGEAADAHHRGELTAPPRVHAAFGDGRLVFTAGRLRAVRAGAVPRPAVGGISLFFLLAWPEPKPSCWTAWPPAPG
jgi:hypothetical protein